MLYRCEAQRLWKKTNNTAWRQGGCLAQDVQFSSKNTLQKGRVSILTSLIVRGGKTSFTKLGVELHRSKHQLPSGIAPINMLLKAVITITR